jgi:hypothetical protein
MRVQAHAKATEYTVTQDAPVGGGGPEQQGLANHYN